MLIFHWGNMDDMRMHQGSNPCTPPAAKKDPR